MARSVITKGGKAVQLEGMAELRASTAKVLNFDRAVDLKKNVYMPAAMVLRNEARDLVDDRSIRLKEDGAIFASYGEASQQNVLVGVNYRIAFYAHWEEFGTSRQAPRPFLRPAIIATRAIIVRMVAEGLMRIIEEAAGGDAAAAPEAIAA